MSAIALRVLRTAEAGHAALLALWAEIKPRLVDGQPIEIEARPARRNAAQNAKLHALIGEIAAVREWAGARREPETWKRLLTAAWLRARGENVAVLPALDGHGIDVVFRPTHTLTVAECGELIEFIEAWRATTETA